jgi:hypothetical protein
LSTPAVSSSFFGFQFPAESAKNLNYIKLIFTCEKTQQIHSWGTIHLKGSYVLAQLFS